MGNRLLVGLYTHFDLLCREGRIDHFPLLSPELAIREDESCSQNRERLLEQFRLAIGFIVDHKDLQPAHNQEADEHCKSFQSWQNSHMDKIETIHVQLHGLQTSLPPTGLQTDRYT